MGNGVWVGIALDGTSFAARDSRESRKARKSKGVGVGWMAFAVQSSMVEGESDRKGWLRLGGVGRRFVF